MIKVLKRSIVAVVTMCLCLSLFPMTIAKAEGDKTPRILLPIDEDPFVAGSGKENDPYIIMTEDGFWDFRRTINQGTNYKGKYIKLAKNLNISLFCVEGLGDWEPIGVVEGKEYDTRVFDGHFDGAGHTISGLYIAKGGYSAGLFSKVEVNGSIENLTVKGKVAGSKRIAGIVGTLAGSLKKCSFEGTVEGTDYVGGLAGYTTGSISSCKIQGTVSGNDYVGGIAGHAAGDVIESESTAIVSGRDNVGGIAGFSGDKDHLNLIGNCVYSGNGVSGRSTVGSIVGCSNSRMIQYCKSTGKVTSTFKEAGGIVGSSGGAVKGCDNAGNVVSEGSMAGGIAGSTFGFMDEKGTVSNCLNYGNITTKNHHAGGIVGSAQYDVTDCKNHGKVTAGTEYAGDIIGGDDTSLVKFTNTTKTEDGIHVSAGGAGGLVGSSFGEGNWVMILVLSGIAVLVLVGGAFFLIRRKKTVL